MKERSKELLVVLSRAYPETHALGTKVFWFFSSKKNLFLFLTFSAHAQTETIVLLRQFGRPDAIFAPDPAAAKEDHGVTYDYVRPLATIEPAAIAFGLPVQTKIGFSDVARLQRAVDDPQLSGALVVVAWEHHQLVTLARLLLSEHGARPEQVPEWGGQDFDSIYVVRITQDGAHPKAAFDRTHEGLNGLPKACRTSPR